MFLIFRSLYWYHNGIKELFGCEGNSVSELSDLDWSTEQVKLRFADTEVTSDSAALILYQEGSHPGLSLQLFPL